MKSLIKIAVGVLSALTLVNCKINASGDLLVSVDDTYTRQNDEIEYSHGGWYPAPNQPNFELILSIKIVDGAAIAKAKTPRCEATREVDIKRFNDLEKAVLSARTQRSDVHGVDMGDEIITLSGSRGSRDHYLRPGDSTHDKLVIIDQDADKIAKLIDPVVADVLGNVECEEVSSLHKVVYTQGLKNQKYPSNKDYEANYVSNSFLEFQVILQDQDTAVVFGSERRDSGGKICDYSVKKTVNDAALVQAAKDVEVIFSGAVCDVMMGSVIPEVELHYLNQPITYATASCSSQNRAINTENLVNRVKKLLTQQGATCFAK